MSEFTSVLSSTAFDVPPRQPVADECPREVLGVRCLKGTGFDCLCDVIQESAVYVSSTGTGNASMLTLEMDLVPNEGKPAEVMDSINLIGYVANFSASKDAVSAAFRLSRAENARLKLLVAERGY